MTALNVMLLEDDPIYRTLVAGTLRSQAAHATLDLDLRCHASLAEAKADLRANPGIDAIIADLSLPDSHGSDTYRSLMDAHAPVVVLTADHNEAMELSALSEGVAEFLVKAPGRHLDLLRAIQRARERRRAQEETLRRNLAAEHQRRMVAIGTMSAGIAHEFNNLHAVIAGSVELMLRDGSIDRINRHRLLRCQEALGRARDITSGILDLARDAPPQHATCRLDEVVEGTIQLLADRIAAAGVALEVRTPADPVLVAGHQAQLGQVVMNLCTNALHALAGRPSPRLAVRVAVAGPRGMVEVEDNGCGIPADILPRIFDPFFTTKSALSGPGRQAGTGLGLAICESVVQRHGGSISVRSRPGEGTVFTIAMPCASDPCQAPAAPEPAAAPPIHRGRMLVVDDDRAIRDLLCDLVADHGMEAVAAEDGLAAIAALDHHDRWDAVLLDWHMPALGGRGFLEARGERLAAAGTPVLVITGMRPAVEADPPRIPGLVWRLIGKPFDLELLDGELARCCPRIAGGGPVG